MADKVDKPKKKAKSKKDEKGVLAALPSTRPDRIGTRRAAPAPKTTTATAASQAAARPSATRTAAAAKRSTTPKTSTAPKVSAAPKAATAPKAAAAPKRPTAARPRPVREGAPGIGTAGARDQPSPESGRPSGTELATTAVRAVGEVAQLGITIGGHVLKRVVDRLPKP
jgi:hypothetical protein